MGRPFLVNKKCSKCEEIFPATDEYFYYRNKAKGYLQSFCKPCKKKHRSENIHAELKKQRERRGLVNCKVCGTSNKSKGSTYCSPCLKEKTKRQKKTDKAVYKSRLRKAKPKWADSDELRDFYTNRPDGMHVDHIIPIRGKLVSGLHVLSNLQYLSAKDNMAKSNHYSITHYGSA